MFARLRLWVSGDSTRPLIFTNSGVKVGKD